LAGLNERLLRRRLWPSRWIADRAELERRARRRCVNRTSVNEEAAGLVKQVRSLRSNWSLRGRNCWLETLQRELEPGVETADRVYADEPACGWHARRCRRFASSVVTRNERARERFGPASSARDVHDRG